MGEAGQLGTVAAVLAVVKPGFMKAEACDGCAPHGRIPKVRAARVFTGYHLTLAYAVCEDAACSSIKSVGFVNAGGRRINSADHLGRQRCGRVGGGTRHA